MADRTTGASHPRVSGCSCSSCPTAAGGQEARHQTDSNFQTAATSNEGQEMECAGFFSFVIGMHYVLKVIDVCEKEKLHVLMAIFLAGLQNKSKQ